MLIPFHKYTLKLFFWYNGNNMLVLVHVYVIIPPKFQWMPLLNLFNFWMHKFFLEIFYMYINNFKTVIHKMYFCYTGQNNVSTSNYSSKFFFRYLIRSITYLGSKSKCYFLTCCNGVCCWNSTSYTQIATVSIHRKNVLIRTYLDNYHNNCKIQM